MPDPAPLTYTVEEAARALGCGRDTVYTLVHANQIPHLHLGRLIRIPRDALHAWANQPAPNRRTAP